jgi:diguanylate cyclase (GGDEF)-like protein
MMDLDNFKKINDTWGHPVGDQTLVDAGRILSSCMKGRKGILIRYGGDEFLIMGFLAGEEEAETFRQEIYRKFADYRQEDSLVYRFAISVGYARYREGQKLAELVDAADDALYLEKKRNNAGR